MEAGVYAYGLNMVLAARVDALANNSKRMERDFRLTSVASIFSNTVGGYDDGISFILGTEQFDWFSDWCVASTIFGDGALPHFLPAGGMVIEKGDFIVVQARNLTAAEKRIALLFQGVHL
jgi:hypothetical protein